MEEFNVDKYISRSNISSTRSILLASFEFYLVFMFRIVNDFSIVIKPFHKRIIRKLESIANGENIIRNLLIVLPVGAGKSLLIEYFISWCFARSVNHTFLYISHSDSLIMKHSKETKEICEHPVWTKMFKSQLKFDSKSKANWSFEGSKNRTGLMAAPMGAGITGLDAGNTSEQDFSGALIIDDPIDATKARFANARKDCIRHYDEKLTTRRRTPTTPTILIQQRLHKEDLAGWVLATEPEDWDVLKIEALDEDGQSFWEERYPVVELNKIRTNNPEKFYSQYQQDPITIGGNVIKKEYFKFYQELPDFKYIFITGDTAQKTKEHNDWSVFVVWGVTDYGIYFLDMMRDKLEAPQLLERAKAFYKNWAVFQNKNCRAFYIEDKSSGTGLIQQLEQQTMIPVIGVPKHTDKLSDVEDCTPFMAAGKVFLPYNENHGHNPTVISECVSFTRDDSHAWDDIVDNFVIAIKQTLAGTPSILDVL